MSDSQKLEEMATVLRDAGYTVWPPHPTAWSCEDCEIDAVWVVYSQFAGYGFYCQMHAESQADFDKSNERVWVKLSLEFERATQALLAPLAGHSFASEMELANSLDLDQLSRAAKEPLPRGFEQQAVQLGLEKGWVMKVNDQVSVHPWVSQSIP